MKKELHPTNFSGWLYFYIHFVTEATCFFMLAKQFGDFAYLWAMPLVYDAIAFVPQALMGYVSDKWPKIKMGLVGILLLLISVIMFWLNPVRGGYLAIIILCLGNGLIHVNGAEVTLRSANGKLSPSAIFVAGGSFGVVTGKLLGKAGTSYGLIILLILSAVPFIIRAEKSRVKNNPCLAFKYHNSKVNPALVIFLAVLIVVIRGYMGYGIPTSWNKSTFQTILLFVAMGVGKGLGGVIADAWGVKKTAIYSTTLALPFLLFGDNVMLISLIGVLLFSMTMSITLAILVSALPSTPGLAFGLTTIGLFLGTVPIFFFRMSAFINCFIITFLSVICLLIINKIIRKDTI